jgi:hypothetical protein
VENNPETSEKENESSSENGRENMKVWFQENLRMLVSIVIVIVIAGGIYSYSKRAQAPSANDGTVVSQDSSEGKISVIGGDTAKDGSENQEKTEEAAPAGAEAPKPAENAPKAEVQPASQETGSSFVQTASKGDSNTTLARRSLANYLEKSPDASLTAEHKIYIEDFLRRQVKSGRLKVGDTREFSKDSIANAIEKSKSLSSKQLKNLEKYSKTVSGLN